jgi:isoleucyl-tRNA synthetase
MMFRELKKQESFPEVERRILDLWNQDQAFAKSLEQTKEAPPFIFYDGPPFATGLPHYGHLLAGTIKDIIPRYWTMKGRNVPRRFGWDCHGLPIESLIQKDLQLAGVSDIKNFGVDRFNDACQSSVLKYTSEWRQTVSRMGRWVDFDRDYKTMDADFMESVWWVFKQCFAKGLVYQGYRIQPYSPALATPLSNFETNQGYQDRQDPSLTLTFPLVDRPGESLLVWTTTPWTLPSNMAVAVGAEVEYVMVEHEAHKYWVATTRKDAYFGAEAVVLDSMKGADLAGMHYEPLFTFMPEHPGLYTIYLADFVSDVDGTGAVHIAPSFGEDDFNLGKELGLPLFDPLDEEGRFTDLVPQWQGMGAKDADKSIIALLKEQGRVFRHETFVHSYPHCYRTGVPLLYRAMKTWFLAVDKPLTSAEGVTKTLKEWMVDCNQEINWVPGHIRDGRFGKWLANARDWNISRNRFWGTPLPIWMAEDGDWLCVGSRDELEALSGVRVEDLHKHHIDPIVICTSDKKTFDPKGKTYTRTPEVFDCWFESGSMPYAQNHYPFENKEAFEGAFPADFIAEGLDQTRGWFYTLTFLSAALFQKPAFRNVIVNGIILAENGQKMSKSLKNYPDPNILIERTGADAIRLFMINSAAVKAEDLKFSEEGVRGIVSSVLIPLWNALSFFVQNANADKAKDQLSWAPGQEMPLAKRTEMDAWILALLQDLKSKVKTEMEAFRLYDLLPAILEFLDSLTNWYLRRSKNRFWKKENDDDKNAAYATLYEVLVELSTILAPFLPFVSEELYQILVREPGVSPKASVHHHPYPEANEAFYNATLLRKMELVRELIGMVRSLRARNNLKIRQPLAELTVVCRKAEDQALITDYREIILEELNIKELCFRQKESDLVTYSAKANFKVLGARLGKAMKDVAGAVQKLDSTTIVSLLNGATLEVAGHELSQADIQVVREVKEGMIVEADDSFTVALDTRITEELRLECFAREIINRLQTERKNQDLNISDRVQVKISASDEVIARSVELFKGVIQVTVQADVLEVCAQGEGNWCSTEVNGVALSFWVAVL